VTNTEIWLAAYGRDHTSTSNRALHWICAPFVVVSLIGLLWSVPVPESLSKSSDVLNWGTLFLMAAVVYYFILSFSLAVGTLPFIVAVVATVAWLDRLDTALWLISACTLLIASCGQMIGHWLEGGRASLIRDLNYSMIGPLWILAAIYRRYGIPY